MKQHRICLKIFGIAVAVTAVVGLTMAVSGNNTASDPLVSLSYLTGTYRTNLLKDVEADIQAESQKLSSNFSQQVSDLKGTMSGQTVTAEENDFSTHSLTAGQQFTVQAGGEVLVLSGTVKAVGSGLTDVTAGTEVSAGGSLTANHLYVAGAGLCPGGHRHGQAVGKVMEYPDISRISMEHGEREVFCMEREIPMRYGGDTVGHATVTRGGSVSSGTLCLRSRVPGGPAGLRHSGRAGRAPGCADAGGRTADTGPAVCLLSLSAGPAGDG